MYEYTYEIKKELDKRGQLQWKVYEFSFQRDKTAVTHTATYPTHRACMGYLMTIGKIISKKTVNPGHYKIKVGVLQTPAQAALGHMMR